MRSRGCSFQQALTPNASNMVKEAMSLAKRRGHAQVTPLHVASTMLSSPSGLLRTACLQSHTHPLQSRALELCFNVSLNRLPTSMGSTMLLPSISNALVAAFKRAQAHQRRGSIEIIKIEQEQLIISILDDPGVSRVMREAGFSSPKVKNIVEQSVSLKICSNKPKVSKLQTLTVRNEVVESLVDKKRKNFSEMEAEDKISSNVVTVLPTWLQQYKLENKQKDTDSDNSVHKQPTEKTLDLSPLSPSSSSSNTSAAHNIRNYVPEYGNELTTTLLMKSSAFSCDTYASRYKEMNDENLRTLCDALRSKAPSQKDIIPEIAEAILKCRSGSSSKNLRDRKRKEETWLLFKGMDVKSKEKIGRELAKLVFGSYNSFVSINLRSFSSSSMEDLKKRKRRRDEDNSCSYTQRLFEEVSCDPHRVFFVEDIEEANYMCEMGFMRVIERGRVQSISGEIALLRDAIVILSCERFNVRSPDTCISLDLNLSLNRFDDDDDHNDHVGLLDVVDACIVFSGSST